MSTTLLYEPKLTNSQGNQTLAHVEDPCRRTLLLLKEIQGMFERQNAHIRTNCVCVSVFLWVCSTHLEFFFFLFCFVSVGLAEKSHLSPLLHKKSKVIFVVFCSF